MSGSSVDRDGVRYSVDQDMMSGDFRVMAVAPRRFSYEVVTLPAVLAPSDPYSDDDPYELPLREQETFETPEIREAVVLHQGEVREWRETNGGRNMTDVEAALYIGIERLEPRVQELHDPKLRAQRNKERESIELQAEKRRIADEARAKRRAAAKLREDERRQQEQAELEAIPEYGMF